MNNDKRMILAIAVYAAVITLILNTLNADAHEQFLSAGNKYAVEGMAEADPMVQTMVFGSMCSGSKDLQNRGEILIKEFVSTRANSAECTELKIGNCVTTLP